MFWIAVIIVIIIVKIVSCYIDIDAPKSNVSPSNVPTGFSADDDLYDILKNTQPSEGGSTIDFGWINPDKTFKLSSNEDDKSYSTITSINKYQVAGHKISLRTRNGYCKFPMKAIDDSISRKEVGTFNGEAVCREHSEIAIYINNRELYIGLVARCKGLSRLYRYIESEGGAVHCYGYTAVDINWNIYGVVCIEQDKTKVHRRNKPFTTDYQTYLDDTGYTDTADFKAQTPLVQKSGYIYIPHITGLYYCLRDHKDLIGSFKGQAVAEKDNRHDVYAVSIRVNGEAVGYIPTAFQKTKRAIWEYIDAEGGSVDCYVSTYHNETNGYFYGNVYVKCDNRYIKL